MPRPASTWLTIIRWLFPLLTGAVASAALAMDLGLPGESAPEDTEEFTEAYGACSRGLLDVSLEDVGAGEPPTLRLKYRPSPLYAERSETELRAFFTTPSYMVRDDTIYRLVSLQLHLPGPGIGEQGTYPLLAHFVHYGYDGSFGVLGVRFVEGEENPELEKLIAAAVDGTAAAGLNPRDMVPEQVDVPYQLGPGDLPGCDYRLYWYLAAQPMQASGAQIEALQQLLTRPSD